MSNQKRQIPASLNMYELVGNEILFLCCAALLETEGAGIKRKGIKFSDVELNGNKFIFDEIETRI